MLKKTLLLILSLFILQISASAANWVKITNPENNKTVYLDTDNIEMSFPIYRYWVKYNKGDYTYIFNMASNCNNNTSAVTTTMKYDSDGNLLERKTDSEIFEPIIPDSINEFIHRQICLMAKNNANNISSITQWNSYFDKLKPIMKKNWETGKFKKQEFLSTSVSVTLNYNGEISSKVVTQSSGSKTFDESVLDAISKSAPLASLPYGYRGEQVTFNVKFMYIKHSDPPNENIQITNNGIITFVLAKEKFSIVKAVGKGLTFIIALPFAILGALASA